MKSPFLNFKTAIILSLATGIWFGIQSLTAYATERMVDMGTTTCTSDGNALNSNQSGVRARFKCGDEHVTMNADNSLAVINRHIDNVQCTRYQGSRSGEVQWDCNLPKE